MSTPPAKRCSANRVGHHDKAHSPDLRGLPRFQGVLLTVKRVRLRLSFRQPGRPEDAYLVYLRKALPVISVFSIFLRDRHAIKSKDLRTRIKIAKELILLREAKRMFFTLFECPRRECGLSREQDSVMQKLSREFDLLMRDLRRVCRKPIREAPYRPEDLLRECDSLTGAFYRSQSQTFHLPFLKDVRPMEEFGQLLKELILKICMRKS